MYVNFQLPLLFRGISVHCIPEHFCCYVCLLHCKIFGYEPCMDS